MIEVVAAPDHVVACRVFGKLTPEDYDRLLGEIGRKLKQHERIGVCTDALGLEGMTPAALVRDLRYAFSKLGEFHRFRRGAIITEKRWIRWLARLGDAAFHETEIRTFDRRDHEAALAWVTDVPDVSRTPALRIIPTTRADTFAFAWDGRISTEEAAELVNVLKPALIRHEKVRLLGRIDQLGGIVPGVITESGLMSLKRTLRRKIDRYAIVGGPAWLKRYVRVIRALTKIDVRHFVPTAEQEAWNWLETRPLEAKEPSAAAMLH